MTIKTDRRPALLRTAALMCMFTAAAASPSSASAQSPTQNFNRIATFEVTRNLPAGSDAKTKTLAEIVTVSDDGRTLAYTDGEQNAIGFIDITDAAAPKPAGLVKVEGEATSVAIVGSRVFAAVDTSPSKDKPSGRLVTLDLASRAVQSVCELGGQPDSIAASKDRRFLAIVIENERDETKDKGKMPQLPSGNLTIVPLENGVANCAGKRVVELAGISAYVPEDAEPEFVDINERNEAVVTLQENNHVVLIDLATGRISGQFSAGSVTLDKVDLKRDGVISATQRAENVKREPDAVKWLDNERFVTANEGDYEGGSRGFTIFRKDGTVEWDAGNSFEHLGIRIGHYPDRRSNAKGTEPEGIEVGRFGNETLIFVGSERGSFVAVYRDRGPGQAPEYLQVLPAGVGPEGIIAIPGRNLLVVSSETDGVANGRARSTVMLYQRSAAAPDYPHVVSADRADGTPIPFGALSALAADRTTTGRLHAITDSAYEDTRILTLDVGQTPARIVAETALKKDGKQASYDAEGLVQRAGGGFYIVTEGDPEKKLKDMLLRVAADGQVEEEITLPEAMTAQAARFGFEGVAVTGAGANETVWIAVQREWKDDPKGLVKILSYKPASKAWGVLHYPLSPARAGSWIGLSEIVAIDDETFAVIERDNLFGEGSVKTIASFSVKGLTPASPGSGPVPVVAKKLVRDLGPDLAAGKGYILDKVEGLTLDRTGAVFVVTDNDGVDGSNGETRLLRLGMLPLR
jgi:hypothetical protein